MLARRTGLAFLFGIEFVSGTTRLTRDDGLQEKTSMRAEWSMSEEELRGIILEKLWTHRRKTIMFDRALKDLLIPIEIKKSILKQLERGGLIRYTFEPDTGLGSGDMTFKGLEVAEGTASPPFPIAIYQLIQTGDIRMENASGVERMNVTSDQAQIVETRGGGLLEWISKGLKWVKALFGFGG